MRPALTYSLHDYCNYKAESQLNYTSLMVICTDFLNIDTIVMYIATYFIDIETSDIKIEPSEIDISLSFMKIQAADTLLPRTIKQ